MPLDVNAAREYFANVIRQGFPGADVSYKEGAVANATAFFIFDGYWTRTVGLWRLQ